MPSSTKFVGTGVNDTQYGTQSWGNPANILADDASVARFTNTTAGTISNYLKGTNCGFAIPAGATIDGIVVEIERHSSVGTTKDNRVRIVKADGSIGATDKADLANNWETVVTIKSYGGPTDLWGETWTPADINDVDFGVVLSAETIVQNRGDVDFIRITVHYTEAGVSGAAQVSWAELEVPDVPAGGGQISWAELEVPDAPGLSEGPRSPSSGVNVTGHGTVAWSSPGNILASDNASSNIPLSGPAVVSNYLQGTGFGFSIPAGSIILGIKVEIERSTANAAIVTDNRVMLVKGGTIQTGHNKAKAESWPASVDAYTDYGGASDLWGNTWTVEEINAANFGVALSVNIGQDGHPRVDHMRITVYYQAAEAGGAQVSWAELEVPDAPVAADGAAQISWAELEVPDEPPLPPVVFEPHVEYQIVITDLAGNILGEIPAKNLQFAYTMNDAGSVTFVLPLQHPKATKDLLDPGKRHILIYRNANLVWGGYFWMVTATTGEATVRSFGEEWFSRLKRRFVDTGSLEYVNVDQFDIAWNLIDFTQTKANGNLGITRFSTTPSGIARTQSFHGFERPNIGEVLLSMTELSDGFDFEVTPDRQWKTYYPKRGVPYSTSGLTFELGKNLDTISYDEDATNTAGEISALGGGEGLARCIAVASDATSLADFGLLQDVIADSDVKSFPTLLAMAQEELRIRKVRRNQPQISTSMFPPFGSYAVGDEARVKAEKGFIEIDRVFRIVAINVQITDEGREVVGVFFDEALL